MDLKAMSTDDLKQIIADINKEIACRSGKSYHEITVHSNFYKGTGKCWIQKIEDGKRTDFVDPYNVVKTDKYRTERTFRLLPGKYLVCTVGSKSHDHRYYLTVNPDFTTVEERL